MAISRRFGDRGLLIEKAAAQLKLANCRFSPTMGRIMKMREILPTSRKLAHRVESWIY